MIAPSLFARSALVAAVLVAAVARPAAAQTEAQKQEAKDHYAKGRRLYDVGRYMDAIDEYQKVYLLTDDPNMLFNIAQAYRLSDHPEEAVRFFRNYLRRAPAAPNRADVETKIAALEKTIEERKRSAPPSAVTAPPPVGATPTEVTPAAPPPAIAPPPAVVTPPPTVAEPPTVSMAPPPPAPAPSGGKRLGGYVLVAGGGALVLTSVLAGAVAGKKAKDLGNLSTSGGTYDPSIESSGKAANTVAVVTGLLGVAAAATGAILLFTARSTPAAAGLPLKVAVFPVAGPQLAGGGARVTF